MSARALKRGAPAAFAAAVLLAVTLYTNGCGGGGRSTSAVSPASASYPANYVLLERDAETVGTDLTKLAHENSFLEAALPSDQNVTLAERFYTSGRPTGVVGPIYDIQPDGLPFAEGTRICLSASGTGYSGRDLVIVTGPNLDQPLESLSSNTRVCAYLEHSSPYSMAHAMNLGTREYTIFGSLNAKENPDYTVKVETTSETHDTWGSMTVVNIKVYCDFQCMESGEREFRFMAGKQEGNILEPLPDDLFIVEHGTYPFWSDFEGMPWVHLRSENGTTVGGIAYLLAAEYVSYFAGSGTVAQYISELDPDENSIQRLFYKEGQVAPYLFVEIIRNETDMPGMIKVTVKKSGTTEKTYMIDRDTAAITKSWVSAIEGVKSVSAAPGESGYYDLNTEVLYYVYTVVGMEDTPDETRGNAYDENPRYLPIQELFAVNVMNLLKGLGWHNLEAIEIYYRDRLELWTNPQY